MIIQITEKTVGPFKRSTTWEGQERPYLAQDLVVQLDDYQTVIWEYQIATALEALPVGMYQIDGNTFQTKKFPNVQGEIPSWGVNRPELKRLVLVPVNKEFPLPKPANK